MKAYLDRENVKLYRYDYSREKHRGTVVDSGSYKYNYDDTNHKIHIELSDEFPCILVYTYHIDTENTNEITITNNAKLAGEFDTRNDEKFIIDKSSASGEQIKFVLTKIDEDNSSKLLPDAGFSIEKRERSSSGVWQWVWQNPSDIAPQASTMTVKLGNENKTVLKTNNDGKIVFSLSKLQKDALYRIKEVKAPDGYQLSDKCYYVIEKSSNLSETEIINNLDSTVKNEIDADSNKISGKLNFVGGTSGSLSLYVPNKYTRLTINKNWIDKDGRKITPKSGTAVHLKLYRYQYFRENPYVKVNIIVTNPDPRFNLAYLSKEHTIAKGSYITAKIDHPEWDHATIVDEDGNDHGQNYKMGPFDQNTTVRITLRGENGTSIVFSGKEPYPVIDENSKQLIEKNIVLSETNNWTYTKDVSQSQDENGRNYVYGVEEESIAGESMNDYKVSVLGDKITTGTIKVVNQETGDKKYTLPSTGGTGTMKYYLLGTLLSMLGVIYIVMKLGKGGLFRKEDHS